MLDSDSPLLERLRAAAELLEAVEHNRGLLARYPRRIASGCSGRRGRSRTRTLAPGGAW